MQGQSGRNTTGTPRGRSTVERLPASVREAVDAAIADGASIDEITALIRENGGSCSRSAVGRYAKRSRDQSRRRDEAVRLLESWRKKAEEGGADPTGLVAIEALRTLAVLTVADLGTGKGRVTAEVLSRLSLALRRIEVTDKLRTDQGRAAAKAAPADRKERRGGV
ncbi:MAG: DUF3486 family protein [Rhodospirillales bacterium]|nr:DUF3486 family protein [Rhodospirillales bacterium]